jgi:hypothetical protein
MNSSSENVASSNEIREVSTNSSSFSLHDDMIIDRKKNI